MPRAEPAWTAPTLPSGSSRPSRRKYSARGACRDLMGTVCRTCLRRPLADLPDTVLMLPRNLATGALTTIDLGDPTEGYACPRPAGLLSLLLAPAGVAVWQVEGCTISSDDQRQPYSMI